MRILIALGIAAVVFLMFTATGMFLFAPLLEVPATAMGFFATAGVMALVTGYLSAGAILEKPRP